MSISAPFVRRPIATSLLTLALILVGVAAYPFLPVAALPRVDFPTIQVFANLPGASAETMATTVAQPLERQISQIPGVAQLTSVNTQGSTQVSAQFDLDRDIDAAATDILAAINAAGGQLPRDLPSPPTYRKINPADSPILIIAMTSDAMPLIGIDDYADNILAQHMSQVSGVSQVIIFGEQKRAVRVRVDPGKLAAMGMTMEDVRQTIANATVDTPKGSIDDPRRSYTVYDNDQLTTAAPYNDLVLAYRNGGAVRVRDIGEAIDAAENDHQAAWQYVASSSPDRDSPHPAIVLGVFKQPGANVIDVVDKIKAELPGLQAALPPSVHVAIVSDRTLTIRASVADVRFTLILSIALVVMVIFLFLRSAWATIIPGVTLPVALICTFAFMFLLGYSLDNLSLMALTIAVGFVVDDAIVMLENIYRHIEDGMRPMEAALQGAGEIGFTIVSISLSLVAVFIPLLFMGGIVGRLFHEFAMTVTIAVLISAVVSLTLTPMMCARFLRAHRGTHGRLYMALERVFDAMLAGYRVTLDRVLGHARLTLAVFVATVALTLYLFVAIPKGFFPSQDTGVVAGFTQGGQDVSFYEMARLQQQVNDVVATDPDVYSFSALLGGGGQTSNTGGIYITLKPWDQRTGGSMDNFINRMRPKLAKLQGIRLYLQPRPDLQIGARRSRTQYEYTLQDANLDELFAFAPKVLAKLQQLPLLRDVATDQQLAGLTAGLTIDRATAARFGIQPAQINDTLYDAFGQRQVAQYFNQVNSYHVILEVPEAMRGDQHTLEKLYVRSQDGRAVPLSTFARLDTAPVVPLSINHQGQFPAVTISFNLAPGIALGQAVTAINGAMADLRAPPALQGSFQGLAQAFRDSLSSQPLLLLAALITVYIILGVLYESYVLPLTILSTLPSAGVGALLMLMAFGFDLSLVGIVGLVLLIGIVKKNGIMMVDFAVHAEREQGMSPAEAIREACLLRFRPILMTTMAALLSGLPLMLGTGAGSELRQPLGYAMVGGLIVSQMLTLYTTPVIYLYLGRAQAWLAGKPRVRRREPSLAATGD